MRKEKSCGAVVYKIIDNQIFFLIEKMKRGHFSIPKGHVENNETEIETALREVKEETNLDVVLDTTFREVISYSPFEGTIKDVVFFIGKVNSDIVKNQEIEVSEIYFYPFDKAYKTLTFEYDKNTLLKAYLHILLNNMKKVILIGSPGSGKSYLTSHLKDKVDLPIYHLDKLYWYDDWKHISRQELINKQEEIMKNDKWLIDGHFQSTLENRIKNADTIIHFNMSGLTCVNGVKHRIKNHPIRDDMPSSCIEKELDPAFETCMLNFKKEKNKEIFSLMKKHPSNVLTITSKKMLNKIISYLTSYKKLEIRLEKPSDYFEVEKLTKEAFFGVYQPGCDEHFIVNKLRETKYYIKDLDYVVTENNIIVASIFYFTSSVTTKDNKVLDTLSFGPISVRKTHQKQGYGKLIINYTLQKAKEMGYPFVLITGNPNYYHKFGFESASKYNIYLEGMDQSKEADFFMIKVFDKEKVKQYKGVFKDAPCFMVDKEEFEKFDKEFEKNGGKLI